MAKKKTSPGSAAYLKALQKIFQLQSETLTAVLPHAGERGANDEERCRAFLSSVLPRRYSIGSGFVLSSSTPNLPSNQQDVVIYDDFQNSPLHRELSASVFPVEMVYATVEVKGSFQSSDVLPMIRSIASVRKLSMRCKYEIPHQQYLKTSAGPVFNPPGRFQLLKLGMKQPPRAFVFAYDTKYTTRSGLKKALESALNKVKRAHLHGIVVLSKDWFAFQRPYTNKAEVDIFEGDALLRFVNNMLQILKATVIREADMASYLQLPVATVETEGGKSKV